MNAASRVIQPTVGRVVWYRPSVSDVDLPHDRKEPLAALVTRVWGERCVNLVVFDANGNAHGRTSVRLVQQDDEIASVDEAFAVWMPYQRGQAAKNDDEVATVRQRVDALEAVVAALTRPKASPAEQGGQAQPAVKVGSEPQP